MEHNSLVIHSETIYVKHIIKYIENTLLSPQPMLLSPQQQEFKIHSLDFKSLTFIDEVPVGTSQLPDLVKGERDSDVSWSYGTVVNKTVLLNGCLFFVFSLQRRFPFYLKSLDERGGTETRGVDTLRSGPVDRSSPATGVSEDGAVLLGKRGVNTP